MHLCSTHPPTIAALSHYPDLFIEHRPGMEVGCCAAVAAPTAPPSSSVRTALSGMIAETLPRVESPAVVPTCGWRTRAIIHQIKALASMDSLLEFESTLRDVLVAQETRLRTKLSNRLLFFECHHEEICLIHKTEQEGRVAIQLELATTVGLQMNTIVLLQSEENNRQLIRRDYNRFMKVNAALVRQQRVADEEYRRRTDIVQLEGLSRAEVLQRRLIEVGQEVQLEMYRRNTLDFFRCTHALSTSFLRDARSIFRAEERDRMNIEKLSFMNLAVYYTNAQSSLCRVLRDDILTVSSRLVSCATKQCLVSVDMQNMFDKETELRAMVHCDEQSRWSVLYSDFLIHWRDVYNCIQHHEGMHKVVASVELYERRFIHDKYRHGINAIYKKYGREHTTALMWEGKRNRLFEEYTRTVSIIWQQESDAVQQMYEVHHHRSAELKSLDAKFVLCLEEERGRRRLLGQESRTLLNLFSAIVVQRCAVEGLDGARRIASVENTTWNRLMQRHLDSSLLIPLEIIMDEEGCERVDIEQQESFAAIDLQSHNASVAHRQSVSTVTEQLCKLERRWRSAVLCSETSERQSLHKSLVCSEERSQRKYWARDEAYNRGHLNMHLLAEAESSCRLGLETAYRHHCLATALCETTLAEAAARRRLATVEKERYDFLVGSVPYEQLFLRACEVDELSHRLHLIHEAELTIRSCAYSWGCDAPIRYCSEELKLQQVQLKFFSLNKLLLVYSTDLLKRMEPEARQSIELDSDTQYIRLKYVLEEATQREKLMAWEQDSYKLHRRLLNDAVENQRERELLLCRPSAVPTVETLLGILGAATYPSATAVQRDRAAVHQSMNDFLSEVYWTRDDLFFEESICRQQLMESLFSEQTGSGVIVEVHGFFFPSEAGREPAFLTLWHANDSHRYTAALEPKRQVRAGGLHVTYFSPANSLAYLVAPAAALDGTLFIKVTDVGGSTLSTTDHRIAQEDAKDGYRTVFLNDCGTRLRLVFHCV